MGLYDREYYREGAHMRLVNPLGPAWRTAASFWIIAINVGVFFLQLILRRYDADRFLYCVPERVIEGGELWRLLTAAFCHDTAGLGHLFFNMLVVFFFAPQIERLYGRRDFIAFYCAVAVLANLVFCLVPYVAGGNTASGVNGASGCCMALLILCALYFPHQMVIVFFLPVPLWLLASFLVATDLLGFLRAAPGDQVAYVVHLAGAALGALHRFVDLRLGSLLARFRGLRWRVRIGRRAAPEREFRVPPDGIPRFVEDLENQKLDRILEKVGKFGRESLTEDEEEFLNRMSQRYRGRP